MDLTEADWLPLLKHALEAPPDVSEIRAADGRVVTINRDPEPGIVLRLNQLETAGDEPAMCVFQISPVAVRPASYPESLPFVAHVPATVCACGDLLSVVWHQQDAAGSSYPLDLSYLYDQLVKGSIEEGWERTPPEETDHPPDYEISVFWLSGERRVVSLAARPPMVSVWQRPVDPDPGDEAGS